MMSCGCGSMMPGGHPAGMEVGGDAAITRDASQSGMNDKAEELQEAGKMRVLLAISEVLTTYIIPDLQKERHHFPR